jgi:hypothetical protein
MIEERVLAGEILPDTAPDPDPFKLNGALLMAPTVETAAAHQRMQLPRLGKNAIQ